MSNTFVTPTDVVRDAALYLNDQLLVANLVNRNVEQRFAAKVGSTVYVKAPPSLGTADEFSSTTSASDVTETSVGVQLAKHFYKRIDLTSDELTMQVDDFTQLVVLPAVRSLIRSVEGYFIDRISGGFARNLVGTAGTNPSTHAHVLAAEKKIFDNRGDNSQLVGLITSTVHASLAALNIFTSQDYGAERPAGLRSNSLGMMSGVNWFRSPNAATFDSGDVAGTPLIDGTVAAGESTVVIDGFTSATGTVYEGTRFAIAGHTTIYTVTADVTLASNEGSFSITPVLEAEATDEDAITFQTEHTDNIVYNPAGVAAAIVPGAIMGPNVAAASVNGLGLRVISDVSTSTLAGTWVFDLYAGCRVVQPNFGAIMQG